MIQLYLKKNFPDPEQLFYIKAGTCISPSYVSPAEDAKSEKGGIKRTRPVCTKCNAAISIGDLSIITGRSEQKLQLLFNNAELLGIKDSMLRNVGKKCELCMQELTARRLGEQILP